MPHPHSYHYPRPSQLHPTPPADSQEEKEEGTVQCLGLNQDETCLDQEKKLNIIPNTGIAQPKQETGGVEQEEGHGETGLNLHPDPELDPLPLHHHPSSLSPQQRHSSDREGQAPSQASSLSSLWLAALQL